MGKELLKSCYLFRDMSADELGKIETTISNEVFNKGDEVFSQGDEAKALYLIKHGSVHVLQKTGGGDQIQVAVLGTGSHFGEMAFLDKEKRSASVEVMERTELMRVDYSKLKEVLRDNPIIAVKFFKEMSLFLAGRLRLTTNDLSFAREMNLKHF